MAESNKEWCEKNCPYLPECGGGLCNVVLEALKNEPLPVLNVGKFRIYYGDCPHCGERIYYRKTKYCPYCGKAVKWND